MHTTFIDLIERVGLEGVDDFGYKGLTDHEGSATSSGGGSDSEGLKDREV
jgi:hypothetical protein